MKARTSNIIIAVISMLLIIMSLSQKQNSIKYNIEDFEFPIIGKTLINFENSKQKEKLKEEFVINPLQKKGKRLSNKLEVVNSEEFDVENIQSRVKIPTNVSEIEHMVKEGFNVIITFHAEWCGHCKKFIPVFEEVSKNTILSDFYFYKVQCAGDLQSICDSYNVTKYPTIKVFINGKALPFEPPRDKSGLSEFLIKLLDRELVMINSTKDLENFNENYGSISFSFYNKISNSSDSSLVALNENFNICVNEISRDLYLMPYLYFGNIELANSLQNKDITYNLESTLNLNSSHKTGVIVTGSINNNYLNSNSSTNNSSINLYRKFEYENSCKEMIQFITNHQYPLFKNLSGNYIKRLQTTTQKMFILLLDINVNPKIKSNTNITGNSKLNSPESIKYLQEYYVKNPLSSNSFIFGYLSNKIRDNAKLFEYFKITDEEIPMIVVYDFYKKKFYVDLEREKLEKIEDFISRVDELSGLVLNNGINWSSGNVIEDFLFSFGIELTTTSVMILIVLVFVVLFSLIFLCSYFCDEKIDKRLAEINYQNMKQNESINSETINNKKKMD